MAHDTLVANGAATTPSPPRHARPSRAALGLLALALTPALAGLARLHSLSRGAATTADDARFAARPALLAAHIVAGLVFSLGGALQVTSARRARAQHRALGYALLPAGFLAALTGLGVLAYYPADATTGPELVALRAASGVALLALLALGARALQRRDLRAHGAWMLRAYALASAPGTQAVLLAPLALLFGGLTRASTTLGMTAGWAVHLVVAERLVRRASQRHAERAAPTMNALVYDRYGGPEELYLARVPRPTPGPGRVLVRVEAAALNALDRRLLRADPFLARFVSGLRRPGLRVLGADLAGVVEAVGPGVTRVAVGDRVFGDASNDGLGAFAERACLPERAVALAPEGLEALEAAALPLAGVTALQAVRDAARVRPGQRVLVYGAGGGVGAYLVQLARAYGAEVTAVAGPRGVETARSLGAARVLDYTNPEALAGEGGFDAVFGVNGGAPLRAHLRRLAPGGVYVMVGGSSRQLFEALLGGALRARLAGRRAVALQLDARTHAGDLDELRALVARGALRPVVDRVYPLAALPEALRYLEAGSVRGKVVLDARGFDAQ